MLSPRRCRWESVGQRASRGAREVQGSRASKLMSERLPAPAWDGLPVRGALNFAFIRFCSFLEGRSRQFKCMGHTQFASRFFTDRYTVYDHGGYAGINLPGHIGPFGLHDWTDRGQRFNGAFAAIPFIEFFE